MKIKNAFKLRNTEIKRVKILRGHGDGVAQSYGKAADWWQKADEHIDIDENRNIVGIS